MIWRLGSRRNQKRLLRAAVHKETMELLRLGDQSVNPAIAQAAIDIALEREREYNSQNNKSPTRTTAWLITAVVVAGVALCWYVLLSYPRELAIRLVWLISIASCVIIALYLLIYGHLTQDNFMKLIGWIKDYFWKGAPKIPQHDLDIPLGQDLKAREDENSKGDLS